MSQAETWEVVTPVVGEVGKGPRMTGSKIVRSLRACLLWGMQCSPQALPWGHIWKARPGAWELRPHSRGAGSLHKPCRSFSHSACVSMCGWGCVWGGAFQASQGPWPSLPRPQVLQPEMLVWLEGGKATFPRSHPKCSCNSVTSRRLSPVKDRVYQRERALHCPSYLPAWSLRPTFAAPAPSSSPLGQRSCLLGPCLLPLSPDLMALTVSPTQSSESPWLVPSRRHPACGA